MIKISIIFVSIFALTSAIPKQDIVPEPRDVHIIEEDKKPEFEVEPRQSCSASFSLPSIGSTADLLSPSYPENYPNLMNCMYTVKSPANTRIRMECDIHVEEESSCRYDVLQWSLTGNSRFEDRVIACGRGRIGEQISKWNNLTIGFKSDGSNPQSSYKYRFKCTLTAIAGSNSAPVAPTTTTLAPVSFSSGSCSCGTRNDVPRIVGGTEAKVNEFPWRAGLYRGSGGIFCGAEIISQNYVLTAAHCVHNWSPTTPLYVNLADHDLTTLSESKNELVKVVQIINHPNYNSRNQDNDMSLLKLERPLDFTNKNIQPICLPWDSPNKDYKGEYVVASGWGTTSSGGSQPISLHKVDLPVCTTEDCRKYYGTQITNNMICTYSPGKDTCQGDSGGSIDWKNQTNGCYYGIGVVSWGVGCAGVNNPGVYAKVGNYLNWIVENTRGETFCRNPSC